MKGDLCGCKGNKQFTTGKTFMSANAWFTVFVISFFMMSFVAAIPACKVQGGASLFSDRCQQCHSLPNPAMHSAAEWPSLVEKMSNFMFIAHKRQLTEQQKREIIIYLQSHAGASK